LRELIVGVDLGATKILAGIGKENGEILQKIKIPTPQGNEKKVIETIAELIETLISQAESENDRIKGIAVAAPGPISFPEAVIEDSPNLAWQRVELREELVGLLKRPVTVDKDTNLAAWGEYHFGQQGVYSNLLYITISTGIGGGIIINDRLYHGDRGGAGEIGHMVIDPNGPSCNCGRRGCLEALASGTAIARHLKDLIKKGGGQGMIAGQTSSSVGAPELGKAARQGDPEALAMVDDLSQWIGIGIANLVNILNPHIVVLGGGVFIGLQDLLLEKVKKHVKENAFSLNRKDLIIEATKLGDDIGLYGCIAAIAKKI
jgi:glucokinase